MQDSKTTPARNLKPTIYIMFAIFAYLSLAHCSYDKSLIYKRNYHPGNNKLLQLSGYYYSGEKSIITEDGYQNFIYPIFFYADGSVLYMGAVKDSLLLNLISNHPNVWGYWGNYSISNDTISIETIASYGGSFHHKRYTRMGVIKKDTIYFFLQFDHKGQIEEDNQIITFKHANIKPDSTQNWIRKKNK